MRKGTPCGRIWASNQTGKRRAAGTGAVPMSSDGQRHVPAEGNAGSTSMPHSAGLVVGKPHHLDREAAERRTLFDIG